MPHPLLVPKMGLTTTETTFVEWLVQPGQAFEPGQSLYVVESEKAATEIPAEAAGQLLQAIARPGDVVPVGASVGSWEGDAPVHTQDTSPAAAEVSAEAGRREPAAGALTTAPAGSASDPALPSPPRLLATPLARRLARQRGIELTGIQGSGPRGRIRSADLTLDEPTKAEAPFRTATATDASRQNDPAGQWRAPSGIELATALRLTEAKRDVPHFYLAVEAEVSALLDLRRQLKAAQPGLRVTLNHFILAAAGRALAAVPEVNRVWSRDGILTLDASDVGMAVDTPRGLLVPILRRVGEQPLGTLARAADLAAEQARNGRLSAADMAGGALTVSNAGMHDVSYMTSIINPGQSMILGVGAVRELFRPDAEGRPALRRELGLVLSADHRVLDGVSALRFLKQLTRSLEHPLSLMLA